MKKGLLLNYLKVGTRSIYRYRAYSVINILGLIIGLSSFLAIVTYLHGELGVDRHYTEGGNIYRLNVLYERPDNTTHYPLIPPAIAPNSLSNFPEIERIARVRYAYDVWMHDGDRSFYEEKVFFAEPDFLRMFDLKAVHGDPVKSLETPNSLVLTRTMAEKYFGSQDPVGKKI